MRAEEKLAEVRQSFERCPLPDEPDRDAVNALLREIRLTGGAVGVSVVIASFCVFTGILALCGSPG